MTIRYDTVKALRIDQMLFLMAFERDVDYEYPPQQAYLDLVSGSVEWLFEEDEDAELSGISATDNAASRTRISDNPDQFLLIPGLSHDDHHGILRSFLASSWTDDDRQRDLAYEAYRGSIGRWKRAVANPDVIRAYQEFRDSKIAELAEEFLVKNNVKVEWRL